MLSECFLMLGLLFVTGGQKEQDHLGRTGRTS